MFFLPIYLYQTAKIGSLVDIQDSEDPEGLRVFYYLVQDLKARRSRPASLNVKAESSPPPYSALSSL